MKRINRVATLCIGLLSLHTFPSCTNTRQGIESSPPVTESIDSNESTPYEGNKTPLEGNIESNIQKIIDSGVDINAKQGPYDTTLLMDAAANGRIEDIKLLIEHKADLSVKDSQGRTALMYALENNKTEVIKLLVERNSDSNTLSYKTGDNHGQTPLMKAIRSNDINAVKYLLEEPRVNINAKDHTRQTALIKAVVYGRKDCVDLLLDKGADMSIEDYEGKTALIHAAIDLKGSIIEALEAKGADVNAKDHKGITFLMHLIVATLNDKSSDHKQPSVANFLKNQKINVNETDNEGKTALMYAIINDGGPRALDWVEALVGQKADIHLRDYHGRTAYAHAVESEELAIAKFLIELGSDPNE